MSPYSSMTIAMCCFSRRKSARSAARSFVSGTTYAGRTIDSSSTDAIPRSWIAPKRSRTWRIPTIVVERAAVDRVARVRRVDDGAERLLGRHLDGDRDDVGPRHHDLRDLLRREVEDLVEHLLLGLLELADVLRRGDRVPDVLTRVRDHPRGRRLHAQHTEDGVRRHLQQPDDRMRDTRRGSRAEPRARRRAASAFCRATALGTSSPSTTEKYVRIANAIRKLTPADSGGSIRVRDQRLADRADEDREDR